MSERGQNLDDLEDRTHVSEVEVEVVANDVNAALVIFIETEPSVGLFVGVLQPRKTQT